MSAGQLITSRGMSGRAQVILAAFRTDDRISDGHRRREREVHVVLRDRVDPLDDQAVDGRDLVAQRR